MASIEKIRKKRGAGKVSAGPGARDAKDDKDTTSRQSSVISVKEATTTDQHDTVEKGTAEEGKTEKSPSPPPRPPSANSRPSSATSHRSTQSAQRAPPDPAGSMVSLKSRQAWTDAGSPPPADSRPMSAMSQTSAVNAPSAYSDPSTNPTTSRRPRTNNAVAPMPVNRPESARSRSLSARSRPASARSLINSKMDANTSSLDEVKSLGPAEMNEAHAYVPYIYARDSIGKIMVDMKNMKYNHIRIVHDIEDNFRLIEDETQAQFNLFVLNLRDQYGVKVKTFRQVIEVHRLELQQKEQYWEELLLSLSGRNTSLLKDKKVLLIQNKVEFERLEREHNETVVALTTKLDETNLAHAKSKKEMEAAHEAETKTLNENKEDEIKTLTEKYEGEKKVLSDELETEKQEVERLRKELENVKIEQSTMVAAAAVATHVQAEPSVVVADLSEEDRARMEEERATMSTERDDIMADRQAMEKDREEFINQRRKHQEDQVLLQGDLNTANKEKEEWRVKYESLRGQLGELAEIKAKYEALYAQFTAISAIAVAAAVDDKAKADDKIAKTEADRDIMLEEKVQMDRDIEKWEVEFKEKNNREPEDKDRPDSIQELIVSRQEAQTMVTSLDTQIETLETLKKGEVPVAEAAPVVPITIQEPEIRTVEVKVPDPEVVAALQTAEAEIDKLKSQLAADKDEMSGLRGSISDLQSQLEQAKAEISKLEVKVSTLETQAAAAVTAGVAVAATGDLEARVKKAEKERKAVEKDLKAALKANNKTAAAAAQSDKLLEVAVREVRAVHGEAEGAAALIEGRLAAARVTEAAEPGEDNTLTIQALEMLATGNVPEKTTTKEAAVVATAAVDSAEVEKLQDQVEELEGNNKELEEKNEDLEKQVKELKESLASGASLDAAAVAIASSSGDDLEELSGQISELQKQVDDAEARLAQEKSAHGMTRDELDAVQAQLTALRDQVEEQEALNAASMSALTDKTQAEISNLKLKLTAAEARTEELDKARLANVPMDTQKEIKALKAKVTAAEKEKDAKMSANADLQAEVKQFKVKMAVLEKSSNEKKTASSDADQKLKQLKAEKDKEMKESVAKYEKREKDRAKQEEKKIAALEKKIQHLEIAGAGAVGAAGATKGKPDKAGPDKATQEKLRQTQRELNEAQNRIKQLDRELASAQKSSGGSNIEAERERKKQEKVLKELEKKLDQFAKKNEKNEQNLKTRDEELDVANKSITEKDRELTKLKAELDGLGVAAAEGLANAEKVKELTVSVKKLTEENKVLTDNYNSERVLRKKYYNMVEDMKGKIRVYCRVRPMSKSELDRGCSAICKSPDEYTIHVEATRGLKEFQFDNIFMPDVSQERVFEDTNNLVQSAVDGYNVCIFAYGQTGSGKTYTIIGDSAGKSLGIAPRAFQRIFDLGDELKEKFDFKVQVYMLELYNDKLLDLFTKSGANEDKMDIKKDKKGMVVVQGAEIKTARNVKELGSLFEEGSKSRHVASTKMNAESSRSHLVVGIVIETTNKISGQVVKGKLSLVDLAGSERAAKTEASAEQLKEAMSINKSLSALGDVISALSSEQSFIPYRNNKLTMLMQDSLGGNAKTLMFVNVSPADYNADETVTSLTYAARVKLITNDASKNADNKEIARLKGIISKLKSGEAVEEEEEGEAEG